MGAEARKVERGKDQFASLIEDGQPLTLQLCGLFMLGEKRPGPLFPKNGRILHGNDGLDSERAGTP